jgi:uracil-DNA glycosylase family 4
VKHFKFLLRGKRRLHKTPGQLEIAACHQWLAREIASVHPSLIVAMGATAARAVFGRATAIEANRGRIIGRDSQAADTASDIVVTVHPSYLLRVRPEDRELAFRRFVADLRLIQPYLARATRSARVRKTSAASRERHTPA